VLTEEDYYPEALALTPTSTTTFDMSASRNERQVLKELEEKCAMSRSAVANIGFMDGAGWPASIFDSAELPVFGGTVYSSASDKHWLMYIKGFVAEHATELSMVYTAVRKAINDEATVIDWSGYGQAVDPVVVQHLRATSHVFKGVTENTMYGIVAGLETDFSVIRDAEGQMVRCILSAATHDVRACLYSVWVACVLRLGCATQLDYCQTIFNTTATLTAQSNECGVDERMSAAYFRASNHQRLLVMRWDLLIEAMFKLRREWLCDIAYDAAVCGRHPPGLCPLSCARSVIPDPRTQCFLGREEVMASPASSCTLGSDSESDDESEEEEDAIQDGDIVPFSDVDTRLDRRGFSVKGVPSGHVRVVSSGHSSPVYRR
jgi:hypothetical protein